MRARHSLNEGFGEEFYRKEKSLKRFRHSVNRLTPKVEIFWAYPLLKSPPLAPTNFVKQILRTLVNMVLDLCKRRQGSVHNRILGALRWAVLFLIICPSPQKDIHGIPMASCLHCSNL